MTIDIFSRYIVGWEIHEEESYIHAQGLIKKAVFQHCTFNQPLVLHSDNGSPMKAQNFQALLENLGIQSLILDPELVTIILILNHSLRH